MTTRQSFPIHSVQAHSIGWVEELSDSFDVCVFFIVWLDSRASNVMRPNPFLMTSSASGTQVDATNTGTAFPVFGKIYLDLELGPIFFSSKNKSSLSF